MSDNAFDGLARIQTANDGAAPAAMGQRAQTPDHNETAPKPSTLRQVIAAEKQHIGRVLLTAAETAREVYSVSERKFHDLRAKGLVPDPVVLGERSLRWVRYECEAHVLTLPRQRGTQEVPSQLRRKIERLKASGQAGE